MRLPPSPLAPALHQREKERKIYWQDERDDQVFRRKKKKKKFFKFHFIINNLFFRNSKNFFN
jgi:hypothetical protein